MMQLDTLALEDCASYAAKKPVRYETFQRRTAVAGIYGAKIYASYCDVIRAKIVLLADEGLSNDLIAARLDSPRQIVSKWRKRFALARLPGLEPQLRGDFRSAGCWERCAGFDQTSALGFTRQLGRRPKERERRFGEVSRCIEEDGVVAVPTNVDSAVSGRADD